MLFNSHGFLFIFLPIALAGFFVLRAHANQWTPAWLAVCSLFFYGWWNVTFLPLFIVSILMNYLIAWALVTANRRRALILQAGIAANILLLGYYKYAAFFIGIVATTFGFEVSDPNITLPIGISFYTFTQIAFLVDVYRRLAAERGFIKYVLFVSYFPHLIAGPLLHHSEMMPQFGRPRRRPWVDIAVGLTLLSIGLFKKVIIADSVADFASQVFQADFDTFRPSLIEAWSGAIGYTLQIYFDFSGYSDMAIGISRLFGIRLPANFASPYQSTSIIQFWRRWHMTLSRFLRDYLYFPLGGNRRGQLGRHRNLMVTMVLGGLWHGAGWTFVIWGGLHGLFLVINHAWQQIPAMGVPAWIGRPASWLLTFLCVVVAWVFFRAETPQIALAILKGMAGLNGIVLPPSYGPLLTRLPLPLAGLDIRLGNLVGVGNAAEMAAWYGLALVIALALPNSQQFLRRYNPVLDPPPSSGGSVLRGRPTLVYAVTAAAAFMVSVVYIVRVSEFLYFRF